MSELGQMEGERGGGQLELVGDAAGGEAVGSALHQQAEDRQPALLGECA
jgi:hypothetical protein